MSAGKLFQVATAELLTALWAITALVRGSCNNTEIDSVSCEKIDEQLKYHGDTTVCSSEESCKLTKLF